MRFGFFLLVVYGSMVSMDWQTFFKGKRVTLMGLGVLGRGIGDAKFLSLAGAETIVTDMKGESDLSDSINAVRGLPGITLHLGGHVMSDFQDRDLIIKGANVPLDSVFISEAKKNGIPVSMSTALFARFAGIPIIGITGTRGKSTVTHLIAHVLRESGKNILLGGNVRGVSTLAELPYASNYEYAVLELDSWQLQGFHEEKISPHVAVFTSFMPDHMNYYKNDMKTYFYDKSAIFAYQKNDDVLVADESVIPFLKQYADTHASRARISMRDTIKHVPLRIPGAHNVSNAACAFNALLALGIPEEHIINHLQTFTGVPGRLENLGVFESVMVVNDNNSTTPDAVMAGIRAYKDTLGTVILGGADKGLDLSILANELNNGGVSLVLLSGSGTERLKPMLSVPYAEYVSLSECVKKGIEITPRTKTMLFSPGFASFSHEFKNEYERNDTFVNEIMKYQRA